jgi:hypothetical protein
MKQTFLFTLLFILSLHTTAQNEETYYDILIPSQDQFVAHVYYSYKEVFEKYCEQPFMTEEAFHEKVLIINPLNPKDETGRESETYTKLIDAFEKNVTGKFRNLDVYYSDEDLDETNDHVRLTTKITSELTPYHGGSFFGVSKFVAGCKGSVQWFLEVYQADQRIAKGMILTVVVNNEYEEPLQLLEHKELVKGLKGAGVK